MFQDGPIKTISSGSRARKRLWNRCTKQPIGTTRESLQGRSYSGTTSLHKGARCESSVPGTALERVKTPESTLRGTGPPNSNLSPAPYEPILTWQTFTRTRRKHREQDKGSQHWSQSLPFQQFQALFHSLFKGLSIFPSRYLFAIGLSPIFSFRWNLPPILSCSPKQLDSLKVHRTTRGPSHRRGFHPLWSTLFQTT